MAKQLAFYFDASACGDCKVCQVACKDKNDLPLGVRWRRVYQYSGGGWVSVDDVLVPNNVFSYSISISCMHCENPACVEVCPTQAMQKGENGVVTIDENLCVGCRYCEWACPYAAPQYNEARGVMTKCNFCQDLLAKGQNPACVDACVMRALDFGELEELRAKYGDEASIEPLPSAEMTKPAFVMTPHKHSQKSGHGTGRMITLPDEV